jgi:hypothetical protein
MAINRAEQDVCQKCGAQVPDGAGCTHASCGGLIVRVEQNWPSDTFCNTRVSILGRRFPITVSLTKLHDGSLELSTLCLDRYMHCRYFNYSKREALRLFREHVSENY